MSRSGFNWQACPIFALSLSLMISFLQADCSSTLAANGAPPIPTQRPKSTSPYVGSAMAVLATLQQAHVLPPEGTREADHVIQSVIQLQSTFAKGTDRFVQDFANRAVADKHGQNATAVLARFRSGGWTAEMLEALADADLYVPAEELQRLATGLGQFNLSVDDFKQFMQLVRDGRSALAARGQNFEEVYALHRNTMPGMTR